MKINKALFGYIEHELFNYEQTKKEIEEYKETILEETNIADVPNKSAISDTTASKAIKLTTSTRIVNAERVIDAIERSNNILGEKHRLLFVLKYIECLSAKEIYLEMNISERSYYRLRRELVIMVAQQLGLIKTN